MATLYAQSNHSWSARSGKWNTAANGTGITQDPTSADTLDSNTRTITVDTDLTAVEINTRTGGFWSPSASVTITANIVAGTSQCLYCTSAASLTVTVNGNVYGSTTAANVFGIQTFTSYNGNLIVNGDVYGGGTITQTTNLSGSYGVLANGTNTSIVTIQGGTIYGGFNAVGVQHVGGTLRIYSHLKGYISNAILLNRSATNTVEIGTPASPVTISSGDKPFTGVGLRIETTAVNTTVNIHCSGLNPLGGGTISINGNTSVINLTMYGGAPVKGGQLSCITCQPTSGALTITGDIYGSDYSNGAYGVNMSAPITCTVNGDVYGGQTLYGVNNHGININSVASTVLVNGTAYAGICNNSSGIFKTGSNAAVIRVRKAVGSSFGNWLYSTDPPSALQNSYGVDTSLDVLTTLTVGSVVNGPYGGAAVRGAYIMSPTINSVTVPCYNQRRESPNGPTSTTISYTFGIGSTTYMPIATDVLTGTTYGITASPTTGTLAVPSAADVLYGAPTGTTTGTASVTPTDILNYPVSSVSPGTVGERVARTLTSEELAAILEAQPN